MNDKNEPTPKALGGKVAQGGAILLGGQMLVRLVNLLSMAVLARLLAIVVVGFVEIASDLSIGQAMVRLPAIDDSHFSTAFTLGLLRGVLLCGMIIALAVPAAKMMAEPALAQVFLWISLVPLIRGMHNPKFVLFARKIEFRQEFAILFISSLVGAGVTILLALIRPDYWALVFGTIATAGVEVALSYLFTPYLPGISLRRWRDFLGFGGWLLGANILKFAGERSDTALLGARLGTNTLGYYSMGDRIATNITSNLAGSFARAVYAALASISSDPARMHAGFFKSQQFVFAVVAPLGIGASLCARELILIFAGHQWLAATFVVQWLAPAIAFNMLGAGVLGLALAIGDTRAIFIRNLMLFALRMPITIAGIFLYGFVGAVIARVVSTVVETLLTQQLANRITGEGFGKIVSNCWRSIAAGLIMALVVAQAGRALPEPVDFATAVALIALKATIGGFVYMIAHYLLWRASGRPAGPEAMAALKVSTLLGRRAAG